MSRADAAKPVRGWNFKDRDALPPGCVRAL